MRRELTWRRAAAAGAMVLALAASTGPDLAAAPNAADPAAARNVPAHAPRTGILRGRGDAFRAYVRTGEGAAAFARIKEDFDREYLKLPFPAEPLTYGDPEPRLRDSAKADLWRQAQDVCGVVSGVAEAAALLWVVTGERPYLDKAREFLLASTRWSLDASGWPKGPSRGTTDVAYNDEAHFRLWRKLPLVFDQIRAELSAEDRATIVAHFRERGRRSAEWIEKEGRISRMKRNSLEVTPSSHPVRFMPMTGLSALALWDDVPESRDWWTMAYRFYRDQFSPWGGDDGGWAEGPAYWRGTMEHASFQDALLAIGDPLAYQGGFWRQHGYFQVYNVQPYLASGFGDFSNAGKFNLEPVVAEYLTHLARVTGDGAFLSFARLCTDTRPPPAERGLRGLDRIYPTAAEFLVRNFIAAGRPVPEPVSLAGLPQERHFRDVGWVAMHSALGRSDDDIHVSFVSSQYGSFSHNHAHQNAFVLNAFGRNLAIASGYREFHNSPHHDKWTRQTLSKNALLIDGEGQKAQSKEAVGRIERFEATARYVWTRGEAASAYRANPKLAHVQQATRDLIFVDRRYLVVRDVVQLEKPGRVSWLLHGERPLAWDAGSQTVRLAVPGANLTTRLLDAEGRAWKGVLTERFTVPVDPKYSQGGAAASYSTGTSWGEQGHFAAESPDATRHVIYAVLWPERGDVAPKLEAKLENGALVVRRPDGRSDTIELSATTLSLR
jgi:hypothetical protein